VKFIVAGGLNIFANWKQIQTAAIESDQLGYWGFVLPDHYMWGRDRGGDSTVETWTALTYLAAKTEKIRLGTLVTPIPFRPPGMLAKTVSTLDLLSNGRTILGVGAGWSRTEFEGYSKWNSNKIRVDKTREGLDLILKLWTQEKVDFKGKFYHANGAFLEPKPVQKPHPPLLFGGIGPRMLRTAGEYGDICMLWTKLTADKEQEKFQWPIWHPSREITNQSTNERSIRNTSRQRAMLAANTSLHRSPRQTSWVHF